MKPVIANAIGRRLPALREGASTSRVAEEARVFGIPWRRETVTLIEHGRRGLSVEEVLLLPLILSAATGSEVRLVDFFVEDVRVTERITLKRGAFKKLLTGHPVAIPGHTPARMQKVRAEWERQAREWRRVQRPKP
jgi:hypothetical protein